MVCTGSQRLKLKRRSTKHATTSEKITTTPGMNRRAVSGNGTNARRAPTGAEGAGGTRVCNTIAEAGAGGGPTTGRPAGLDLDLDYLVMTLFHSSMIVGRSSSSLSRSTWMA